MFITLLIVKYTQKKYCSKNNFIPNKRNGVKMSNKMKLIFFWILAAIITLAAVIYQERTDPSYDKRTEITINDIEYRLRLIRSHSGESDAKVELLIGNEAVGGELQYRIYPGGKLWETVELERRNEKLVGNLPQLPPAGKYEYKITLFANGKEYEVNNGEPVIIWFKGAVPEVILFPHILLMFLAMLFGNLAGIMALFKHTGFRVYTTVTLIILIAGGFILGPWIQWHAFGEAWRGVPFDWGLSGNKTLIAFIFWLVAFLMNRKKTRPVYTVIAAVVMLIIYSIPPGMYG